MEALSFNHYRIGQAFTGLVGLMRIQTGGVSAVSPEKHCSVYRLSRAMCEVDASEDLTERPYEGVKSNIRELPFLKAIISHS